MLRRVDALTRSDETPTLLERGALVLDLDRMISRWSDNAVTLTLTEFWVVHALAKHPGHVRTRDQLMNAANVILDDSTVTSQIKRIRNKFTDVDPGFSAIETVYGMGYRWSGDQSET